MLLSVIFFSPGAIWIPRTSGLPLPSEEVCVVVCSIFPFSLRMAVTSQLVWVGCSSQWAYAASTRIALYVISWWKVLKKCSVTDEEN